MVVLDSHVMTRFQWSIITLVLLSSGCFAQVAPLSKILTADGFLDICGRPDTSLSKERLETLKNVAPSQFMEKLKEAMADRTTEVTMCLAYVAGIEHGWKEGHEHGVVAAEFPEGWPKDEQKSLANLPLKQLQAGQAAMKVDVPCIPDYVTIGQERDIVVKYIRDQEGKGNFLIPVAFTSRVVYLAFQQAFQCPAQPTKPPDAIQ